ncbi:hypothetical protein ACOMHN_034481 [Nucella lapillus]
MEITDSQSWRSLTVMKIHVMKIPVRVMEIPVRQSWISQTVLEIPVMKIPDSHKDPCQTVMEIPDSHGDPCQLKPLPKAWLPFSMGRRSCVGENVARPELLLLLAFFLKRFTTIPARGRAL